MAAALDLKSSGETRAGSNPASGTFVVAHPVGEQCMAGLMLRAARTI